MYDKYYAKYHWQYPTQNNRNNYGWSNNYWDYSNYNRSNNNWDNNYWNNYGWSYNNWDNNHLNQHNWNYDGWQNNRNDNLGNIKIKDYGSTPFVVDIEDITKKNKTFRTALWTGTHLQLTLMSIGVGEDIGLEVHPHLDQFIRIEEGQGLVQMGDSKDHLNIKTNVSDDFAIFVPAGKWHNLTNTGDKPIKLYSIYAPPEHPYGTVHETKAIALAAEEHAHS